MKVLLSLLMLLFACSEITAQTINLEADTLVSQFQDADVGAMAFADVDNDGDQDLMITGKGGPVASTLYKNDGTGIFTAVTDAPFINVFEGTVGFQDVNGDGSPDLLITGTTSSPAPTATLYLNDGTGDYSIAPNTPFEPSNGGDFAFGDVDNDGDHDVVITGYNATNQGFSTLYLNDGSGIFTEVPGAPLQALRNSSVAFIDIDNDNDPDLVLAGKADNDEASTTLYTNDGTGNFTLVANTPFAHIDKGDIAIADSDNDGDLDILISGDSNTGGLISNLYINDGAGSFSLVASTPFEGTNVGASNFADFDNDGDQDVLIVGAGSAIVAIIYENQGSNNFVTADSLYGAYLSSTAIGDMDGDSDLDLVIGGTSFQTPARSTKIYFNQTPNQVGITSSQSLLQVKVFPNPSQGKIQIELQRPIPAAIRIFNSAGAMVYSSDQVVSNHILHLAQPAGLYFVVIKTDEAVATRKILLE